jgi:hypothetical protein
MNFGLAGAGEFRPSQERLDCLSLLPHASRPLPFGCVCSNLRCNANAIPIRAWAYAWFLDLARRVEGIGGVALVYSSDAAVPIATLMTSAFLAPPASGPRQHVQRLTQGVCNHVPK